MKTLMTAWLVALTAAIALLVIRDVAPSDAAEPPTTATFDRLTVHRLDVVEPDGKPRVIMSSAADYPQAYFDGTEYPHTGRARMGGLLFFNDDGTEAGGVGYFNKITKDGHHRAAAMISMDQYNQNEIMNLTYEEEDGKRGAGLAVYGDHPDVGLKPVVIANAELQAAKTDADRAAAKAKLDKLIETNVGKLARRLFVGREEDLAMVSLEDKSGTKRLVVQVDGSGEPTIQFFDAAGKLTKTLGAK